MRSLSNYHDNYANMCSSEKKKMNAKSNLKKNSIDIKKKNPKIFIVIIFLSYTIFFRSFQHLLSHKFFNCKISSNLHCLFFSKNFK